jgi:hypothetical protein
VKEKRARERAQAMRSLDEQLQISPTWERAQEKKVFDPSSAVPIDESSTEESKEPWEDYQNARKPNVFDQFDAPTPTATPKKPKYISTDPNFGLRPSSPNPSK